MRGFVNYGQNLFKVSRSGLNLLSRGNKVSRSRKDFLGERVVNYWNNLPSSVRLSSSVDMFKCNLEAYKLSSIDNRFQASTNCYWEVSEHVLSRIETPSALAGRSALCEYPSLGGEEEGGKPVYKQLPLAAYFVWVPYFRVVLLNSIYFNEMPFWGFKKALT